MQREAPTITLHVLEMYLSNLEKLHKEAQSKRAKEIARIEKRNVVLGIYRTEDEIQDAYGWEFITAKERDQLLADLREAKEAGQNALDASTVLTEYLRMLRNDIRQIKTEILEMKGDEG